jgi:hypothetical protein
MAIWGEGGSRGREKGAKGWLGLKDFVVFVISCILSSNVYAVLVRML